MCKFVSLYLIHASTGKGRGEGEGDGSGEGEGEGDCAGIGLGASAVRSASLSLLSRVALSNARRQQFPDTPGSFGTDTHTNKSFISIDTGCTKKN